MYYCQCQKNIIIGQDQKCSEESFHLIEQHQKLIQQEKFYGNIYEAAGPISDNLKRIAPIGSDKFANLYVCAQWLELKDLVELYDIITQWSLKK